MQQHPTPRILETKLSPPAAVATQVPRAALGDSAAAAAVKLVLVRAPAGFGKTTAMAQMRERMEAQGIATAWLTLDLADNDVSRFLHCLGEAVQRLGVEASLSGAASARTARSMPWPRWPRTTRPSRCSSTTSSACRSRRCWAWCARSSSTCRAAGRS
jgi:ATP/maltotriose-dependent transcriptional regulator MalT